MRAVHETLYLLIDAIQNTNKHMERQRSVDDMPSCQTIECANVPAPSNSPIFLTGKTEYVRVGTSIDTMLAAAREVVLVCKASTAVQRAAYD